MAELTAFEQQVAEALDVRILRRPMLSSGEMRRVQTYGEILAPMVAAAIEAGRGASEMEPEEYLPLALAALRAES